MATNPDPPCQKCHQQWENECESIRASMAYWRKLGIPNTINLPPAPRYCYHGIPRDCYHGILEAMVFNTPQRRGPQPPRSPQAGPSLLDRLDDHVFSKVLGFVSDCSQDYSTALISVARLALAYRRAYVMEKTHQYGDLVLGCNPVLVPPPTWFHQRRSRIKSITSAVLPSALEDALEGIVRHILNVSFVLSQSGDSESPKIKCFSATIKKSNGEVLASSKGWLIKGKGKLHELESESRDLAHIATQLVAVARPDAEENFMNQGGANWYLMNSRQSISHLMTEPLLAERMGLPADFGFEHHLLSTLVFEDVTVEAPHHGNSFGLLLMRTIIQHVFKFCLQPGCPDHYKNFYYNLVLCWACPPQFHFMNDSLSFFGDLTAEAVARRAELWGKGMLRNGCLYSRKSASCTCCIYPLTLFILAFVFQFSFEVRFGVLSTDEKTARLNLNAHFSRLGFRSLAGAPLQIGSCQPLHCMIHVTRHTVQDPKFACTAFQRRN